MLVWLNMSLENGPLPSNWSGDKFSLKSCWDDQFFWKKKKRFSIKNLVFLSKCHLEPRPPKRIKVSFFGKHWKFCVQNLLKSSSYIHFKNTKQFNTHKQLTLVKMQQLLLTFITIQMWTLMQRPTACNMYSQSSMQASMYPQVSEMYSHL